VERKEDIDIFTYTLVLLLVMLVEIESIVRVLLQKRKNFPLPCAIVLSVFTWAFIVSFDLRSLAILSPPLLAIQPLPICKTVQQLVQGHSSPCTSGPQASTFRFVAALC